MSSGNLHTPHLISIAVKLSLTKAMAVTSY